MTFIVGILPMQPVISGMAPDGACCPPVGLANLPVPDTNPPQLQPGQGTQPFVPNAGYPAQPTAF